MSTVDLTHIDPVTFRQCGTCLPMYHCLELAYSVGEVLTVYAGCALDKNPDGIFMYKSLLKPIVVAMEVMRPVARYLTFIVGADLLSKFQCNETAVGA